QRARQRLLKKVRRLLLALRRRRKTFVAARLPILADHVSSTPTAMAMVVLLVLRETTLSRCLRSKSGKHYPT
ncbi:MAG: hypothetical protein VXW13_07365, partial [SAR324 cluster bacterium]|nr:hypothetical protein [SAR324 cluster bacterium]